MARGPYRIMALGVFALFGVAMAGQFLEFGGARPQEGSPSPSILPALRAAPVEVVYADTLRGGETLSELLRRSKLDGEEARALLAELERHQNPRQVRAGLVVEYRKSARTGEARGMATRLDPDRTLMLRRQGGEWAAAVEEVPVRPDTVVLAGTVRNSLYQAVMDAESPVPAAERPAIVDQIADRIFAWKVDFSRDVRRGDEFRILYERMVRPDGTARTSRVLAVEFEIGGRLQTGYLFAAGGKEDYYDAEGESVRRAFLRAPLQYRRISSSFSTGRFHPILKVTRPHNGTDYAAATGTPIYAVGDGVVTRATFHRGYGNVVDIRHSRGYATRYAHMSRFAAGVRNGTRVKQGDVIGYVGATGLATGPHLHFEFHHNGRPINPSAAQSLNGDPVPSGQRAAFREMVQQRVAVLERATGGVRLASAELSGRDAGSE